MGKRKNKSKKTAADAVAAQPSEEVKSTPVTPASPTNNHTSAPLPKETPRKGLEMQDMRPVSRSLDITCHEHNHFNSSSSDNDKAQEDKDLDHCESVENSSAGRDKEEALTTIVSAVQEVERDLQHHCESEASSQTTPSYIFNGPVGRSIRHIFHFILTAVIRIWAIFARFVFWYLLIDLSPPSNAPSGSAPAADNKASFRRRALSALLVLFFWPFYLFLAAFRVSSKVVMAAVLTIAAPHPEASSRKETDTSTAIGAPATSASYCNDEEGECSRTVTSSHLL